MIVLEISSISRTSMDPEECWVSKYIDSRHHHLPTISPTIHLGTVMMASQDVEMTFTRVILVRNKNITELIERKMPLIGCIAVRPVYSHSMILPLWVANLYSSATSKINELEYAVCSAYLIQRPLDEDY